MTMHRPRLAVTGMCFTQPQAGMHYCSEPAVPLTLYSLGIYPLAILTSYTHSVLTLQRSSRLFSMRLPLLGALR
jgi:hypothetical protein